MSHVTSLRKRATMAAAAAGLLVAVAPSSAFAVTDLGVATLGIGDQNVVVQDDDLATEVRVAYSDLGTKAIVQIGPVERVVNHYGSCTPNDVVNTPADSYQEFICTTPQRFERTVIDMAGGDDKVTIVGDLNSSLLETAISLGDGNDQAFGTVGFDAIIGGDGWDTIHTGGTQAGLTGLVDAASGDGDNDTIIGGNGLDIASGGNGNDHIDGNEGSDVLSGDDGDDEIHGGSGHDVLLGGSGSDSLLGGLNNDAILGGDGRDAIDGGAGEDDLFGENGGDAIQGQAGDDDILGLDGEDWLDGGTGRDEVHGGLGQDKLYGGDDKDLLYAGGIGAPGGDGAKDHLYGGGGNDQLYADTGEGNPGDPASNDELHGEQGDDFINAQNDEVNVVYCGDGNDTVNNDSVAGGDVVDDQLQMPYCENYTPFA